MTSSVTVPAVYVGTYHQYNGGSIFGKWFDLTDFDDEDEFYDACRALHAAEDDPEFMFQDFCGFSSWWPALPSTRMRIRKSPTPDGALPVPWPGASLPPWIKPGAYAYCRSLCHALRAFFVDYPKK